MARAGLYPSDIKKARDALIAQGKHPSVDAVRIELGNTGSKTTIHKYLKELEVDEGEGTKRSISEALQDLVERLAAKLHEEADARVGELQAAHTEQRDRQALALSLAEDEIARWRRQAEQLEGEMASERNALTHAREDLQQESIKRLTAEQQMIGIKERLSENEAHRVSLEEKHAHARQALEHYRQSVKEQRDLDQRRHEQQLHQCQVELRAASQALVVKQEEVTRLNQEGVRMISDLSHARRAVHDEQVRNRSLESKIEVLQLFEQRCVALEGQCAHRDDALEEYKMQLAAANALIEALQVELKAVQLDLASARSARETQQAVIAELKAYLVPAPKGEPQG